MWCRQPITQALFMPEANLSVIIGLEWVWEVTDNATTSWQRPSFNSSLPSSRIAISLYHLPPVTYCGVALQTLIAISKLRDHYLKKNIVGFLPNPFRRPLRPLLPTCVFCIRRLLLKYHTRGSCHFLPLLHVMSSYVSLYRNS